MTTNLMNMGCSRKARRCRERWRSPWVPVTRVMVFRTCRVTTHGLDCHLWRLPGLGCQEGCCNLLQQEWVGHTSSRQLRQQLHLPLAWVQGTHLQTGMHLHIPTPFINNE